MKKPKIMLAAIGVLAVIGGVLALKVKPLGQHTYCYIETETQPPKGECTKCITNAEAILQPVGQKIYYTTTTDCSKCKEAEAPNEARLPFGH